MVEIFVPPFAGGMTPVCFTLTAVDFFALSGATALDAQAGAIEAFPDASIGTADPSGLYLDNDAYSSAYTPPQPMIPGFAISHRPSPPATAYLPDVSYKLPGAQGGIAVLPGEEKNEVLDPASGASTGLISDPQVLPHDVVLAPGRENLIKFADTKGSSGDKDGKEDNVIPLPAREPVENGRPTLGGRGASIIRLPTKGGKTAAPEEKGAQGQTADDSAMIRQVFLVQADQLSQQLAYAISNSDFKGIGVDLLNEAFRTLEVLKRKIIPKNTDDTKAQQAHDGLNELIIKAIKHTEFLKAMSRKFQEYLKAGGTLDKPEPESADGSHFFNDCLRRTNIQYALDHLKERSFDINPLEEAIASYDRELKIRLLNWWLKFDYVQLTDDAGHQDGQWWFPSTRNIKAIATGLDKQTDLTLPEHTLVNSILTKLSGQR